MINIMNRFVFDLDNTLIFTDSLNNDSYNYALHKLGLEPINDCKRVTRDIVFRRYPNLSMLQKNEIIELKQKYFINNLEYTIPNIPLIKLLKSQKKEFCILWTSAENTRVRAILEYYQIYSNFKMIFFSKKNNVQRDVEKICEILNCNLEQLVFFEDDIEIIRKLQKLKLYVISV